MSPLHTLDWMPTRLLYVEDDDDLRDMLGLALGDAGFEVTSAPSAEEALVRLESAPYEVVVTDYNMAGETGAWLLANAAARGYLRRTAAIILTAQAHPLGVSGYKTLRKPVDLGVLLAAIHDARADRSAPLREPSGQRASAKVLRRTLK